MMELWLRIHETHALTYAIAFSFIGVPICGFIGVIPFLFDKRMPLVGVIVVSACALLGGFGGFAFGIIYRLRPKSNAN